MGVPVVREVKFSMGKKLQKTLVGERPVGERARSGNCQLGEVLVGVQKYS